jgi:YebC/PmpR family DNA-binding regulatory protein
MSGHSKWSTIKHKKAATDAKRGQQFSKIAREITVAAQRGGDPTANPTLRMLIQKARAVNMPSDNVDRAIKKGTGELAGDRIEEISYEGFAPGGVQVVIEAMSDNRNRTTAEVKHLFTRNGGSLGGGGGVSRVFIRKGVITVPAASVDEDKLPELALEAGAEDMTREGDNFEITTDPAGLVEVSEALAKNGVKVESSEISRIPQTTVPVTEKTKAASILRFVEALEELEDVQNVYANFDISDALMAEIEAASEK